MHSDNSSAQFWCFFHGTEHVIAEFFFQSLNIFFGTADVVEIADFGFEFFHPSSDLLQLLHQRLDFLGSNAQLFDQTNSFASAISQGSTEASAGFFIEFRIHYLIEIFLVLLHQSFQGSKIVWHSLQDFVFFKIFSQRYLDGSIKRKLARMYSF